MSRASVDVYVRWCITAASVHPEYHPVRMALRSVSASVATQHGGMQSQMHQREGSPNCASTVSIPAPPVDCAWSHAVASITHPSRVGVDYPGMASSTITASITTTSTTALASSRPGRRARLAAVALLGLAPLTNCMCANVQRNRAYRRHLHGEIDRYVHASPRVTVAERVHQLMTDRGHPLPAWDGDEAITTTWEIHDDHRRRYRLELQSRLGGVAVRMTEQSQDKAPPSWVRDSRRRDHDLEGAVLERLHPGRREGKTPAEVGAHVYDIAPSVLWEATREELLGRGELLEHYDVPLDVTASTMWVVYDGAEPERVRHEISIVRLSDSAHRLQVHRTTERGKGPRPWRATEERRDYDLELALIRRHDSPAAEAMEAAARREGEEAFEHALDSGAVACGR